MSWDIEQSGFGSIVGMDARAAWLLKDNQADYIRSKDALIPFVIRIENSPKDNAALRVVGELVAADLLYVSSWYLTESSEDGSVSYPKPGKPFVAYAGKRFFDLLAGDGKSELFGSIDINLLREADKSIELRTPLVRAQPDWLSPDNPQRIAATTSQDKQLQDPVSQVDALAEDTVIMAVIDDGIPVANTRFQNLSGTRIEYFWRQDGPDSSLTVPNGTELTRSTINTLLSASEAGGVVDEDYFYKKAGLAAFNEPDGAHKSVAWRASHGAHVMDTATGFSKEMDVKNRPIIAVQLPSSVVENTSGSELDQHVIDAIEYILQRADAISPDRTLPLVINLSFGRYSGPHDGSSELERFMDNVVHTREKTRIVLPAGNSRQERCHSVVTKTDLKKNQDEVTLNWRVQPDDRTHSYCHIWLPADANFNPPARDRIKISVIAPNGDTSSELGEVPGQADLVYRINGSSVCRVSSRFIDETSRSLLTLSMMPTSRNDNLDGSSGVQPRAPAGTWKIIIKDISLPDSSEIHSWVERDDTVYGYSIRGRQSYFDDTSYQRYDETSRPTEFDSDDESFTKRLRTLNGISTGENTIVVGAMYRKEDSITEYSACGPISAPFGVAAPSRDGPDLLVVADDSKVHRGIAGAGTKSGSVVYFNGTSVAAPRVAREVADLLAAGGNADRNQLAGIVSGLDPAGKSNCGGNGRWGLKDPQGRPARIEPDIIGMA